MHCRALRCSAIAELELFVCTQLQGYCNDVDQKASSFWGNYRHADASEVRYDEAFRVRRRCVGDAVGDGGVHLRASASQVPGLRLDTSGGAE